MPIYDITGVPKNTHEESPPFSDEKMGPQSPFRAASQVREKSGVVSSILARFFFAVLFVLDLLWGVYVLLLFTLGSLGRLLSLGHLSYFTTLQKKTWISIKRSLVCGLALVAGICSPAFGIMIACTYFLMYDRNGIEEIVPASLQDQFRDFFK